MFRILSCVGGHHDIRLVALAAIVCLVTSFVAVNLFRRACVTKNRARAAWIATAGIVSGCGIWATHFIAMLAYEPGLPVAYDELLTGFSLLIAVGVMSLALGIAAIGTTRGTALIGGALVGIAIAAMHYLGMLALEVPGH
jgi:NO-binding membrane sensor protein with MHYT domain